jgi:hypothetical protein
MMTRYEFREDLLPISLLITRATLHESDIEPIFAYYRSLLQRRIKFIALSDVRAAREIPNAMTRARFADASAQFASDAKVWSLGAGLIVESKLIRGALMAIEWLSRGATPNEYFGTLPEALDWAIAKLEAAEIFVPLTIRRFRESAK